MPRRESKKVKGEWLLYAPPTGAFCIRYPSDWNISSTEDGNVSVYPDRGELAVTINSVRHKDPKCIEVAKKHVRGFSKFARRKSVCFEDVDVNLARARFTDRERTCWYVVAKTKANRVVIGSLNGSPDGLDDNLWMLGEGILDSITLP